ncbi:MAG: hypothetical protein U1E77_18845 [Inhella sp.]
MMSNLIRIPRRLTAALVLLLACHAARVVAASAAVPEPVPAEKALALEVAEATTVADFLARLAELPAPVSAATRQGAARAFNLAQRRRAGLPDDEPDDPPSTTDAPKGFVQLRWKEGGPYHLLEVVEVVEDHQGGYGIDGGQDRFSTFVLDQQSLQLMQVVEARVHAFRDGALLVTLDTQDSCMGPMPGNEFEVIRPGAEPRRLHHQIVPGSPVSTRVVSDFGSELVLEFVSTEPLPEKVARKLRPCDLGGPQVQFTSRTYTLHCGEERCAVKTRSSRWRACEPVGACD